MATVTGITVAKALEIEADAAAALASVSRTSARSVGQGEQLVNVKDYGAVGNGGIDDSAAIQAALTAAVTLGASKVLCPKGDYLLYSAGLSVPEGVSLVGEGIGVSRLIRGGSVGTMVDLAGGSIGSTITTLTANAAVGAATLTVASTTGISAGDWLLLVDDRAPDPDKPTRPGGELVRVSSIASGTSLVLVTTSPTATQSSYRGVSGTFDDAATEGVGSYLTSSNARLVAMTLAQGSSVQSLSIVNPTPGVGVGTGINAGQTLNPVIRDVEISGIDGTGIVLGFSVGAKVSDCDIHDLVDDTAASRYGYGINITGAASDIEVSDCTFARMRHAVTTDGHTSGGIPRRITISDCRAFQTHHSSFDTHGAVLGITFSNCISVDSAVYGFNARGRNVIFKGCEAIRSANYSFNVGALPARRIVIDSCIVRDGGAAGVFVAGDGIVDVYISNLFVDGCAGSGCVLGYGNTRQVVVNSRFFNIGQGGSGPYYGITFSAGTLGTVNAPNSLICDNLFIKNKTYGVSTDYNAAVRIPNAVLTAVVVIGNIAHDIYTGGSGFILDSGTSTVLWNNTRPATSNVAVSGTAATTTALTDITSIINLTKRRGMSAYNLSTNKPVWAKTDGASGLWIDATGATVHTPV